MLTRIVDILRFNTLISVWLSLMEMTWLPLNIMRTICWKSLKLFRAEIRKSFEKFFVALRISSVYKHYDVSCTVGLEAVRIEILYFAQSKCFLATLVFFRRINLFSNSFARLNFVKMQCSHIRLWNLWCNEASALKPRNMGIREFVSFPMELISISFLV